MRLTGEGEAWSSVSAATAAGVGETMAGDPARLKETLSSLSSFSLWSAGTAMWKTLSTLGLASFLGERDRARSIESRGREVGERM